MPKIKPASSLLKAHLVTEVLECGERVTAIRLEYDEEVCSSSVANYINCAQSDYHHSPNEDTVFNCTYRIESALYCIDAVCVNNTGCKDDAAYYGRYVFLHLLQTNNDPLLYTDYVPTCMIPNCNDPRGGVFPKREKLRPIRVHQIREIETKRGAQIARGSIEAYDEIRLIVDDFQSFQFITADGHKIDYNVFFPKGYEHYDVGLENLPLVVYYPSGNARAIDYTGKHIGALGYHCTCWASAENQQRHPSFVMAIGGDYPYVEWGDQPDFEHSWVQQAYVDAIRTVCSQYNIDLERIYACSSGGGGGALWQTAAANAGLFAGCIIAANDFYSPGGLRNVERGHALMRKIFASMKSWIVCEERDSTGRYAISDDDARERGDFLRDQARIAQREGYKINITDRCQMWNGYLRGEAAECLVREQIARMPDADAFISFLIPGTTRTDKHWAERAFYSNAALRDWLYTCVRRLPDKKEDIKENV